MKIKLVELAIAVFWGVNLIFIILYGIIQAIYSFAKGIKGKKSADKPEYAQLFLIVLIIPILSILILLFIQDLAIPILSILYACLILITGAIVLFNKNPMQEFADEEKELLISFREFGIMLILDDAWFLGWGIYFTITRSDIIFILNNFIISLVLIFFLLRFQNIYRKGKETVSEKTNLIELKNFFSHDFATILNNLTTLTLIASKFFSKQQYQEAEEIYSTILDKAKRVQTNFNPRDPGKNKEQISQIILKSQQQLEITQKKIYLALFESKFKKVKKLKRESQNDEIKKIFTELIALTEQQLIKAKKNRNLRAIQEYGIKITNLQQELKKIE